jgi:hypothetical protein
MNIERLFADLQLAEMEHNAHKTDVSLEKYETAKFAYERAVEKSKEPAPKKPTEKLAPANTKTAAPANNTPKTEAPAQTPPADENVNQDEGKIEEEKKTE